MIIEARKARALRKAIDMPIDIIGFIIQVLIAGFSAYALYLLFLKAPQLKPMFQKGDMVNYDGKDRRVEKVKEIGKTCIYEYKLARVRDLVPESLIAAGKHPSIYQGIFSRFRFFRFLQSKILYVRIRC